MKGFPMRKHVIAMGWIMHLIGAIGLSADWPGFRGPTGMGISEDTNVPLTWSDTKNITWKVKLPGPGSSSPIVYGDQVFVTCYSGYGTEESRSAELKDLKRHLVCVNRNNGEEIWSKAVAAKLPEDAYRGNINQHGYASNTPVTDGKNVYATGGFPRIGTVAIRIGGKDDVTDTHTVWSSQDGSYVPSPVIYDGHIYWVSDRGEATCLDATSGRQIYKEKLEVAGRGKVVYASVNRVNDKLYAVSRWGGTYVIAAKPKFELLAHNKIKSDPSDFNASPAISNGQMFLRSNQFLYCMQQK